MSQKGQTSGQQPVQVFSSGHLQCLSQVPLSLRHIVGEVGTQAVDIVCSCLNTYSKVNMLISSAAKRIQSCFVLYTNEQMKHDLILEKQAFAAIN